MHLARRRTLVCAGVLGSSNGTVLVSGVDHQQVVVELPEDERTEESESKPVEIHPGDELYLARRYGICRD